MATHLNKKFFILVLMAIALGIQHFVIFGLPISYEPERGTLDDDSQEFLDQANATLEALRQDCAEIKILELSRGLFLTVAWQLEQRDRNLFLIELKELVQETCGRIKSDALASSAIRFIDITIPAPLGRFWGRGTDPASAENTKYGESYILVIRPFLKNEEGSFVVAKPGTADWDRLKAAVFFEIRAI